MSRTWLLDQLPLVMAEDDFTARFLMVFQDVADTLVETVGSVPSMVDPAVAPPAVVRWLTGWIGASPLGATLPDDGPADVTVPARQEREWLALQARARAWRGTVHGLRILVEGLCGGEQVRITDGGGVRIRRPGSDREDVEDASWVRVEVSGAGGCPPADLMRIVRNEVPAPVRVEVVVGGVPVGGVPAGGDALPVPGPGDAR